MLLPDKSGESQLAHLQAAQKSMPEGLLIPALEEYNALDYPDEFYTYYQDFLRISRRRKFNENGPLPISFEEIQAWGHCSNVVPSYLQVKVICALDDTWMKCYRDKNSKKPAPVK